MYCYLNEQLRYPPHLFLLEYKFAIYASGRTFSPNGMEKIGHIPHVRSLGTDNEAYFPLEEIRREFTGEFRTHISN